MQGVKRKRRCQNQCQQHLFTLKNLKNNSKYDIKLTFCPKYQRQPLPPQHTFAEYNNDGLFYTSAFILGVDKKVVAKNLQKEMLDHQKLIKQNCQKYNQLVFPRPNSKHTTCSVCKQQYKNYYQHIFSDEHSQKIQLSPYNVFVKQLCQLFKDHWEGCAEKADQEALNEAEREKVDGEKRGSEQLNLDDILQQQDINQNPSRISRYIKQESEEQEQEIKEVVMRRPSRVYEPIQPQRPQRVQVDRQSRKKNINFAAFFEDQPKKKIINDHREAINVSSKKMYKTMSGNETKSKQKIGVKKQQTVQETDPFIIEYNARSKRKQKKSYYYLKKKQREERQQREKQMLQKQHNEQGTTKSKNKIEQDEQQISDENQIQDDNDIQKSSEEEYEKYLDEFHRDEKKNKDTGSQIKKTFSANLMLFEEVQKNPPAPLFQSFANANQIQQKNIPQKISNNITSSKIISPENALLTSEAYSFKKPVENVVRPTFLADKKMNVNNEQKQQIFDKNKINYSQQNQLPLFHKLRNPQQKEAPKQPEIKTHKPTQQVFNEYEQKIRQYKQKDYNPKYKLPQKINPFQEKFNSQVSPNLDQSTVKINKTYPLKEFDESYRYASERKINEQFADIKTEPYNPAKYNSFSQAYYKKSLNQKQITGPVPVNPLIPGPPYPNPHQFYPPYNYPLSPYGYPLHDASKSERPPLKYGQQRQPEPFDRGYYYGGWQPPYYMQPPPGSIIPQSGTEIESAHKNFANKGETKPVMYPPYPAGYPGYPPANYPGYYHPPGTPYPSTQRPQYPPNPSNLRMPPQPNTSININFPMYLGPPYHGSYQYPPNPQRYSGPQPSGTPSSQYLPSNQSQIKPPSSQYNAYGNSGLSSLPPYAEYQEYKKRQNDRRR